MRDELLMYSLILKGGNALQLVYEITDRASMDIDFSMNEDFSEDEVKRIKSTIEVYLQEEFYPEGLHAFDVKFEEKPKSQPIKEWKGYNLKFKVTTLDKVFEDDLDKTRRNAIKMIGQSTQFSVDISSYEYVEGAENVERDGVVLRVYTPKMIIIEKLRALCQSIPEYREIVKTARPKGRARDFYDIWNIFAQYPFDFDKENTELLRNIFSAKRVPTEFLGLLENYRDLQKENWPSVEDTLTGDTRGFDFYFDFVQRLISKIKNL